MVPEGSNCFRFQILVWSPKVYKTLVSNRCGCQFCSKDLFNGFLECRTLRRTNKKGGCLKNICHCSQISKSVIINLAASNAIRLGIGLQSWSHYKSSAYLHLFVVLLELKNIAHSFSLECPLCLDRGWTEIRGNRFEEKLDFCSVCSESL